MKNKKTAFTLIELLVVMVIIGILATVSVATFGSNKEKADAARTTANCVQKAKCEQAKTICEENGGTNCDSFCEGDVLDCDDQNIAELAAEVHGFFTLRGSTSDSSTNSWSASGGSGNYVPNRFGTPNTALDFGSRMTISPSIQPQTGEVTVCAWINPDNVSGERFMVGDYDGHTNIDETIDLRIYNNQYMFISRNYSNGGYSQVYGDTPTTGSWDFLCGVKGNSTDIYKNGILMNSVDSSTKTLGTNSTDPWWVGAVGDNSRRYDGQMSDIMIFDRAFSAEEIFGLYSITNDETTYNQFLAEFDE